MTIQVPRRSTRLGTLAIFLATIAVAAACSADSATDIASTDAGQAQTADSQGPSASDVQSSEGGEQSSRITTGDPDIDAAAEEFEASLDEEIGDQLDAITANYYESGAFVPREQLQVVATGIPTTCDFENRDFIRIELANELDQVLHYHVTLDFEYHEMVHEFKFVQPGEAISVLRKLPEQVQCEVSRVEAILPGEQLIDFASASECLVTNGSPIDVSFDLANQTAEARGFIAFVTVLDETGTVRGMIDKEWFVIQPGESQTSPPETYLASYGDFHDGGLVCEVRGLVWYEPI